jgi:hypothetical protein
MVCGKNIVRSIDVEPSGCSNTAHGSDPQQEMTHAKGCRSIYHHSPNPDELRLDARRRVHGARIRDLRRARFLPFNSFIARSRKPTN